MIGEFHRLRCGIKYKDFYIAAYDDDTITLGRRYWRNNDTTTVSNKEFNERYIQYLGKSHRRWWWHFVPFFKNNICPYGRYT